MKITNIEKTPATRMNMKGAINVTRQIPISSRDGSPSFAFRVFTIEPGGNTPFHQHHYEHLNYVIQGSGKLKTASGEYTVTRGDFMLVQPNETHQYVNTDTSTSLVIICGVPVEYE